MASYFRNYIIWLSDWLISFYYFNVCRDYKGRTPVHFAAQAGHSGLLITLLCAGGSPTCPDKLGYTPIHWAAYNGKVNSYMLCMFP